MSEVLMSMYPVYTKSFFEGSKTMEFRRRIVNDLLREGKHTIYLYETKRNSGAGKIVGQADVKQVFITLYSEGSGAGTRLVSAKCEKMKELYLNWCEKIARTPSREGWYADKDFSAYRKRIGWTGDPGDYYNYSIELENIQKYAVPMDISEFAYLDGKTIAKPPQNMCRCKRK